MISIAIQDVDGGAPIEIDRPYTLRLVEYPAPLETSPAPFRVATTFNPQDIVNQTLEGALEIMILQLHNVLNLVKREKAELQGKTGG